MDEWEYEFDGMTFSAPSRSEGMALLAERYRVAGKHRRRGSVEAVGDYIAVSICSECLYEANGLMEEVK